MLIVLEGIDGCGKSTQATRLADRLRERSIEPLLLREPGGTALGEQLRALLLDPATHAGAEAELLLYQAARAQLVREVLLPRLHEGRWILLDRFWPSTVAYQAYGLGLDEAQVRAAIAIAVGPLVPELALWFRLDAAEAARRRAQARGLPPDRIEQRGLDYLSRVDAGYAAMAANGELIAINSAQPADAVADEVWRLVQPLL